MRYRLRTLLIALTIAPPVIAGAWFSYRDYCERQVITADRELELVLQQILYETKARTTIQFPGSLLPDFQIELREQMRPYEQPGDRDQTPDQSCVD
jgi:hypothetical protein